MASAQARRPNILWFCTDQQRYDTIGALGNPYIETPNLDRLCAEGTAFTNAYCQSPICTPSRVSFLTGLYPSTVHANINGAAQLRLPHRAKLITTHLRDLGYTCALSGKLHLTSPWNQVEERVDDGYSKVWYSHSGMHHYGVRNDYGDWLRSIGAYEQVIDETNREDSVRRGIKYRDDVPFELHQTTWCTDRAIEWIEEGRDEPWLFSVNVFDPHPPYDAPRSYAEPYEAKGVPEPIFAPSDFEEYEKLWSHYFQTEPRAPSAETMKHKASYYGMVQIIDENIGRLLDALERTGQRENTLVIFMSDHGEMLGDHGLELKGCRFFEGLTRVPLILSWPGQVSSDRRVEGLVELTDIAPTLADICGEPLPWTQGESLMPLLKEEGPRAEHREYVRCEYYNTLGPNWGTGKPPLRPSYATMYREGRYKLNVYHENEHGELYDLEADPEELNNLWDDKAHRRVKCELIKRSFDASMTIADPGSERVGRY